MLKQDYMKQVLDLTKTYSKETKSKILAVRMTPDEHKFLEEIAHSSGCSLSIFTREALQSHINLLLSEVN